jgi:hypothetical protein
LFIDKTISLKKEPLIKAALFLLSFLGKGFSQTLTAGLFSKDYLTSAAGMIAGS